MAVAIVAGALANKPFSGGEAWVRLSWVLGMRRLGFDVWFAEELDGTADAAAVRYFEEVARDFGLGQRAVLLDGAGRGLAGPDPAQLAGAAAEAEVLFNLSGHLRPGPLFAAPRRRVYVDLDPGFTQAWHADPTLSFQLGDHDHYATVGLNVGGPGWERQVGAIDWIPTLPPVVLEEWPAAPPESGRRLRFTTVATWRSPHGSVAVGGNEAPLKHHEFRRLLALPGQVPEAQFELALDIHPADGADREALLAAGWELAGPREVAGSPVTYREYLRASGAEFSVAQGVYVASRSGWFSDRSAAYLACGRPALVQDTGVAEVPLGEGLLAFGSLGEAAEGARRIAADPAAHAAAARRIAEERLDSDLVLGRLLERIGVEA